MNILWLQSGGCGGCTMSLLCAEDPNVLALLAGAGLEFLWHPTLSEATGAPVRALLGDIRDGRQALDILCVEGSILRGPNGTGRFHMLAGTGRSMLDWLRDLAPRAGHVVAVGTCATYGGVTTAGENPADAVGVQYDGAHPGGALAAEFRSGSGLPVINVAGCPTHPDWVTETLLMLAAGEMRAEMLDGYGRPRFYADHLVHHACPKNEFYEYKASATHLSEMGCMMEHLGIATFAAGMARAVARGRGILASIAPHRNSRSRATALPRRRSLRASRWACRRICRKRGSWRWRACRRPPRRRASRAMRWPTGSPCPPA
jgi:ferredoxin hydrogenase small subunit